MLSSSEKHTEAGERFTELVLAIFRVNGLLEEAGDRLSAPSGQTTSRWQVLGCIDAHQFSVADIAKVMGLARQSVQRTANNLVDEGLAEYAENPRHARAKLVRITASGHKALKEIEKRQVRWANELARKIGVASLTEAVRLLAEFEAVLRPSSSGE